MSDRVVVPGPEVLEAVVEDEEHPASTVIATTEARATPRMVGRRRLAARVPEGCMSGVLHRPSLHGKVAGGRAASTGFRPGRRRPTGFDGPDDSHSNEEMSLEAPSAPTGAPRSSRLRWWALVVVCLAMFMNALDSSIVNVALPDIQKELHFSASGLTWVVDAFLISFGSFLLMAGRLGDLIGRRRVFLSGIVIFTLSSMACGLAQSQSMLIVGRFCQGIGE